jgi:hypothetical protein
LAHSADATPAREDTRPNIAGLVNFLSVAQIAPLFLLPISCRMYFAGIFPSKIRPFVNRRALGIGIA